MLDVINDEVDVLVDRKEMKIGRIEFVFTRHACSPDKLQLMQFQCRKRKFRKPQRLLHQCLRGLTRQSQYDVPSSQNPPCSRPAYRIFGAGKIMPAVNALLYRIVQTLDTVFYQQERLLIQFLQVIEQFLRHTVGTRTDDQSHYPLYLQGFLVHLL